VTNIVGLRFYLVKGSPARFLMSSSRRRDDLDFAREHGDWEKKRRARRKLATVEVSRLLK
jgi:hypothetical protein